MLYYAVLSYVAISSLLLSTPLHSTPLLSSPLLSSPLLCYMYVYSESKPAGRREENHRPWNRGGSNGNAPPCGQQDHMARLVANAPRRSQTQAQRGGSCREKPQNGRGRHFPRAGLPPAPPDCSLSFAPCAEGPVGAPAPAPGGAARKQDLPGPRWDERIGESLLIIAASNNYS